MSADDVVLWEQKGPLAWLTLNRTSALNAINHEVLERLSVLLDRARETVEIQAVVLAGAGDRAFSAGADIRFLNQATPLEVRDLARLAVGVTGKLEKLGKPTAAAINGFALGGGLELAEACMFRLAVPDAMLGHPEVRIGAVAAWGGTTRLPRLVGRTMATELLLTGRQISAEQALSLGLVNRVVEPGELAGETDGLLNEVLQNAQPAVNLTWEAMNRGLDVSLEDSLGIGADMFGLAASTDDFREGTGAFLQKRKPLWKGK